MEASQTPHRHSAPQDADRLPGQPVLFHELGPAAGLYVLPAPRLRTFHLFLGFHQVLGERTATRGSLLPRVLRRGSLRRPDLPALAGHLEQLYGSSLGASAAKIGDHQIVELTFSCPGPESLRWATRALGRPTGPRADGSTEGGAGGEDLVGQGVELLAEMFSQPARPPGTPHGEPLSDEGLREDYFREEKEGLARDIAAIGDDRMSYSHYRCLVEMCRGEPFAEHSLGRPGELEALTAPALNAFRTELLTSAPFSAYLTGPTDDQTIERVAEGLSSFIKTVSGDGRPAIPPSAPHPRPVKEREVFEEADVEQARLVIGLQTGVLHGDPQHPAQVIFSGLLGGFVHSRLFRRIREEAGLAYYAWARVAPTKGIILISCGIQEKNYGKALDLIRKELESLGRGDFTGDEFEATRNSVLAQAKAALDSPAAMVYGHLERRAAGDDPEEMAPWRSLARVTAGEVKEFGSRPVIDTIYLLGRRGL